MRKFVSVLTYLIPGILCVAMRQADFSLLESILIPFLLVFIAWAAKSVWDYRKEKKRKLPTVEFGVYPSRDQFAPGLLRLGIRVVNGSTTTVIADYWTEDREGNSIRSLSGTPRTLPKQLEPNERHTFEYVGSIQKSHSEQGEPFLYPAPVRACIRLDGPNGQTIRGKLTPLPILPAQQKQ
jgi:hypothetical protein